MSTLLRALVLLALGALLLASAWFAGGERLRLRLSGEAGPGRVIGYALNRGASHDLIAGLRVEMRLRAADGTEWEFEARDQALVSARNISAGGETAPLDVSAFSADGTATADAPSPALRRLVLEAIAGDANTLRWALRREERRTEDVGRILRIEKTETAAGLLALASLSRDDLALGPEGSLQVGGVPLNPQAVRTRAVFSREDPEELAKRRGESLVDYEQQRMGVTTKPARRDFVLQSEPYTTEFHPVFSYEAGPAQRAGLSPVGRQGSPVPSLPIFGAAKVYFDALAPEHALLAAAPGEPDGKILEWFGRVCEGVFTLWGPSLVLMIAAGFFLLGGLLVLSLSVRPHFKSASTQGVGGS